ncbi:hypothetical protein WN944_000277 [Citrus x changshan-huyou]|uniref:Uncharacterized protein n=1 Tax=Citrus x changshan-huyou TaxID=2935761 RepID=A0AAP0QTN8_9ROSI
MPMLFMRPGIPSPGLFSELLAKKPNYNNLSVVLSPSYSGPGTLGDDADALKRDMGPRQSNYTDLILVGEFFCNCLYVERNNEGLQCSS